MRFTYTIRKPLTAVVMLSTISFTPSGALASKDVGQILEDYKTREAVRWTGTWRVLPLGQCTDVPDGYRTSSQLASEQIALPIGLKAEYVTRWAGNSTDMMVLWPSDSPTHLITAVEGGRQDLGGGKFNPSVQRINLSTGLVETILRGLTAVDPIRITPWGTILIGEETTNGGAYEILNPLTTTNVTVTDRTTGDNTAPTLVAKRTALPAIAWEGIVILPNGVLYAGDELRPGTGTMDRDGGAIFKFIPTTPHVGTAVSDLAQSPFASGSVYAARVSCTPSVQYGQGCEAGNTEWIPVSAANARNDADAGGATGYYRPEDMEQDFGYTGPGVRACWANTGDANALNFGEVMCFIDEAPLTAPAGDVSQARIYRFLEGNPQLNQPDNLAFQPNSNALFVIEDNPNGEIYACLADGHDLDEKTDGCALIACVKDDSAEPTGWLFSNPNVKGEMDVYVSIQHSNDNNMPLVDGYRTDDVIKITGIKVKPLKQ